MIAVFVAWAALIYFFVQFLFNGFRIGGFFPTLLILAGLFLALVVWTVFRLARPPKRMQQAAARMVQHPAQPEPLPDDGGSVTFRVAGVTFDNDDGSSRQEILQHLKFGDAPWADDPDDLIAELEETVYDGDTAFNVLVNGYQVGCVPKSRIRDVIAAQQHPATCYVSSVRILGGGTGADGRELSYGCEITLEY